MKNELIRLSKETKIKNFHLINTKNGLTCQLGANQGRELLRDLQSSRKYKYYEIKYGSNINLVIEELITQGFVQVGESDIEQTMNGLCMVLPAQDKFYQLEEGNLYYDISQKNQFSSRVIGLIGISGFSNSYYHNISLKSVQEIRKATLEIADLSKNDLVGDYKALNNVQVTDYGDLDYTINQSVMEKRISDIGILLKNKGIVPIYVGGDHSVTYFLLEDYIRDNPVQIIQIDAHKDMGYQRGSKVEHGSVIRKLSENNNVKRIIQIGIRGCVERSEVDNEKVLQCDVNEIKDKILDGVPVYLTIDSDGFDPTLNPAVNYPLFGGITFKMFANICDEIKGFNLIGIDIVEYNAINDTINKLGAHFIGQVILELLKCIGENYEE